MEATVTAPPTRELQSGRIVAAIVVGLIALGCGAAGVAGLWAVTAKSDHTYISTGTHHYAAGGRAIVSNPLHIDHFPDWLIGKIRVTTSSSDGAATFVGVARKADVDRYLAGVARSTVEDLNFSPFDVAYGKVAGSAVPGPPAAQRFWAASAEGTGKQSISWNIRDGHWRFVVMNADGSAGVTAEAKVGASIAHGLVYALVLLGIGLALGGLVVWLVVSGSRRR